MDSERRLSRVEVEGLRGAVIALARPAIETRNAVMAHWDAWPRWHI